MADQEFLASFGVEIDETGVSRLRAVLEENRELAEEVSSAFSAATEAIRTYLSEVSGDLPGSFSVSGRGLDAGNAPGVSGGMAAGLDFSRATEDLQAFIALAKKPIPLSANASGMVTAARRAYNQIRSVFAEPVPLTVRIEKETDNGEEDALPKMSAGGRFTKPTDVQVAEDGDAEYIIPVKKEDRAVPLLRQLLAELSPAARESLGNAQYTMHDAQFSPAGGMGAGSVGAGSVTVNNQNVSAPVNIQVHASGANGEEIGRSIYDTAERYLVRTLKGAVG